MLQALRNAPHIWLLAAIVLLEIMNPLLEREHPMARLASIGLMVGVALAVFGAVLDTRRRRWLGFALLVPVIAIASAHEFFPGDLQRPLGVMSNFMTAIFLVFVVFIIVHDIFAKRELEMDDIVGAFAGYIMTAVAWGRLYAIVWELSPASFSINPQLAPQLMHWHTRNALFDYYGLATLATIGYNDITTIGPIANTLVWIEVMFGQFYLAVVVATIVGMKLAQALTTREPDR